MKKQKSSIKIIFESFVGMFTNILFWVLIWTGSVLALIDAGEPFLALLLILVGFLKVFQNPKIYQNEKKQKTTKVRKTRRVPTTN